MKVAIKKDMKIITSFPVGPFLSYPEAAKSQFFTIMLLSLQQKNMKRGKKCEVRRFLQKKSMFGEGKRRNKTRLMLRRRKEHLLRRLIFHVIIFIIGENCELSIIIMEVKELIFFLTPFMSEFCIR